MKTAKGWRRAVASPEPVAIIEKREIKKLIDMDFIVICCGGGGIPVTREGRAFNGVDAVIDKDLASARLAVETGVDIMLIATDVEGAILRYGQNDQETIGSVTAANLRAYQREGHFPPGSMGPKVEAAARFVEQTGRRAVIASIDEIEAAAAGRAGTQIRP